MGLNRHSAPEGTVPFKAFPIEGPYSPFHAEIIAPESTFSYAQCLLFQLKVGLQVMRGGFERKLAALIGQFLETSSIGSGGPCGPLKIRSQLRFLGAIVFVKNLKSLSHFFSKLTLPYLRGGGIVHAVTFE